MSALDEVVGPPPPKAPRPPVSERDVALIHARRHPVAIVMVWLFELVASFVIATPVHAWARASWGAHPDGDAVLFRPGGLALVEWLDATGPALSIVLRTSFVLIALFALVGPLVQGAVVGTLAARGTRPVHVGLTAYFPLLAVDVAAALVQGAIFGVGFWLSSTLDHSMQHAYGDERAFVARLVVFSAFAVVTLAAGVVFDLVRVAVARAVALARTDRPLRAGLRDGLIAARRHFGAAFVAWAGRASVSVALVIAGAAFSDRVATLWLVVVVHQLAIFGRAALRTSWLAEAIRFVAVSEEAA